MDDLQKEIDEMTKGHKVAYSGSAQTLIDLGILWWARYHMGFWSRLVVGIRFIFKQSDY